MISDRLVRATRDQVDELSESLQATVSAWQAACRADSTDHPDAEREPVLVATYVVPLQP